MRCRNTHIYANMIQHHRNKCETTQGEMWKYTHVHTAEVMRWYMRAFKPCPEPLLLHSLLIFFPSCVWFPVSGSLLCSSIIWPLAISLCKCWWNAVVVRTYWIWFVFVARTEAAFVHSELYGCEIITEKTNLKIDWMNPYPLPTNKIKGLEPAGKNQTWCQYQLDHSNKKIFPNNRRLQAYLVNCFTEPRNQCSARCDIS